MMANKISNYGIKTQPYIHSRFKLLKQQYGAIYDMLNTLGFGWDDARKCITCDQDVWTIRSRVILKHLIFGTSQSYT
ncbi:hypothetical protein COCNU_scaffold006797G000020 [Cocos nucifera]|nr:hypothetical protein [Cocos nucifera]